MINDPDRYRQDKSPYERPNFPYRCGRAALWGKPCGRGPDPDGRCGGTSECRPFRNGGRWECRRPANAGGPCADGPLPDGRCSMRQPPCRPRPSLRNYRGRLTLLAVAVALAIIAGLAFPPAGETVIASSLSPGALSGGHANFTASTGCGTCHVPHDAGPVEWLKAAWSPNTLSERCSECHSFGGEPVAPHNNAQFQAKVQGETTCVMCHTEHKGTDASVVAIRDAQCNTCHEVKIDGFAKGHPDFSDSYPARRRTAIAFNHATHFGKHFADLRVADNAPKERCISCHDAGEAGRNVPVRPFEETCAGCHASQIPGREMVLFTFPELLKNPFDKAEIAEACGPGPEAREEAQEMIAALTEQVADLRRVGDPQATREKIAALVGQVAALKSRLDGKSAADGEEFYSVSLDYLSPIGGYLLGVEDTEDPESYTEPVRDLIRGMIDEGDDAFLTLLEDRGVDASKLLSGLSPELVRGVGCAWASNREYEAPSDAVFGGWKAEGVSISYVPTRHSDAVARSWLDVAAAGGEHVSAEMREALLSASDGAGACGKCHSISQAAATGDVLKVEWRLGAKSDRAYVRYSHRPHLDVLGPGSTCETCHKLDQDADFAGGFEQHDPLIFASNFKSMEKETCVACHAEGQVTQQCTLCHDYHKEPGFKRRMMTTTAAPGDREAQ